MKRINIYLSIAVLLLLSGCAKVPTGGSGLPLSFSASVEGETKASMQSADLSKSSLKIMTEDPDYNSYTVVTKATDGSWQPDRALFWRDEKFEVSYHAVIFGDTTVPNDDFDTTDGMQCQLPIDQRTQAKLNAADLLYSSGSANFEDTDNGRIAISFRHMLTKVNIKITLGEQFYDRGVSRRTENPVASVLLDGSYQKFRFWIMGGRIASIDKSYAGEGIQAFPAAWQPATADAKTATAVFEAILVPNVDNDDVHKKTIPYAPGQLHLLLLIGDEAYEWTNNADVLLEPGKTVTLPVSITAPAPLQQIAGHDYVEMGDGLKWATCNVGAQQPWDCGDYFAWGEVEPYYLPGYSQMDGYWRDGKGAGYDSASYRYRGFTKYCPDPQYGYDGYWDSLTSLQPIDDAATQHWGASWRMPTIPEWEKLENSNYFEWTWVEDYQGTGVNGCVVTSRISGYEGNNIFIPAAGFWKMVSFSELGNYGAYWTSNFFIDNPDHAPYLSLSAYGNIIGSYQRYYGFSVRPVSD